MTEDIFELLAPPVNSFAGHLLDLGQDPLDFLVYIPFGDGPRICIGKGFAQMEAALLLATIAQRFEIDLVPGFPIVPQPSITLRPEYGIKVQIEKIA